MKKTLHKLLCGLLAVLTLTSAALGAEKIQVVSSLNSVNSVSSAVNAVREQLESIVSSGMLDTSEASRVATQGAELAIYRAATAEIQESEFRIDTDTPYALPQSNAPANSAENSILSTFPEVPPMTLAELADRAREARESILDEMRGYGVETLYDLPIAVRFLTPANVAVTIDPGISGLEIPVSLAVLDTPYYQLKLNLSGMLETLSEPLTVTLRDVDDAGEEVERVEVTLSDDAFAGYLTICFDSDNSDLTDNFFVTETPDGLVYNRYRYNDVTGKLEGHVDESGICAVPKNGNFPNNPGGASPKNGNFPAEFKDMLSGSVSTSIRQAVRKMQLQGAVSGYDDGTFRPDNGVTRQAFAKMLMEALNETNRRLSASFNDVKPNNPFYAYVATVFRKGYMKGTTETTFNPTDPLIRQQECVVIGRILEKYGYKKTLTSAKIEKELKRYKDSNEIGSYAREYVALLSDKKVISPDSNGKFNPNHRMTRGETTELLCALLEVPFQS